MMGSINPFVKLKREEIKKEESYGVDPFSGLLAHPSVKIEKNNGLSKRVCRRINFSGGGDDFEEREDSLNLEYDETTVSLPSFEIDPIDPTCEFENTDDNYYPNQKYSLYSHDPPPNFMESLANPKRTISDSPQSLSPSFFVMDEEDENGAQWTFRRRRSDYDEISENISLSDSSNDLSSSKLLSPDEHVVVGQKKREREEFELGEKLEKYKKRKKKNKNKIPTLIQSSPQLMKYWRQRYDLFSKYDQGIMLDEESWFSVTPEKIAAHISMRCGRGGGRIIIDAFCGVGGNTIQFALNNSFTHVVGVDIDGSKIEMGRKNAEIYGVSGRIVWIVGDFMKLGPVLRGDVVFLSPPWGGMDYSYSLTYSLTQIPMGGTQLFNLASEITPNIAYYLPKNIDKEQLAELCGEDNSVEIETNMVGDKEKAITAYFGNLINSNPQ